MIYNQALLDKDDNKSDNKQTSTPTQMHIYTHTHNTVVQIKKEC